MTQLQQDTIRKLRKELYEKHYEITNLKHELNYHAKMLHTQELQIEMMEMTKNIWIVVATIFCVATITLSTILLGG